MKKSFIKWVYVLLTVLGLFGIVRLYHHLTDDFRLENMTYVLPFEAPWQVPPLQAGEHQRLVQIFDQKFSYIGKGAQCYAFVSEDQQYVLKFFKFKHLKPNLLLDWLPSIPPFKGYKQSRVEKKKRQLLRLFNGYDLAYRHYRKESELIYLHLKPTQYLQLQATVIDKLGFKQKINLDEVVFLIQKKGDMLSARLQQLLSQDHLEEAKQAVGRILKMYVLEYQRGMYDRDHGVMHNTGFIGEDPFRLDVGHLCLEASMQQVEVYKKDLKRVVGEIDTWVKHVYPQYYESLSSFLAREYDHWTEGPLDVH
jgi:hypothetical protein